MSVKLKAVKLLNDDTTAIGSVVKMSRVTQKDTVICPEFCKNGGHIDFEGLVVVDTWGRKIAGIEVPAFKLTKELDDIAIIHPVASQANTICLVLEGIQKKTSDLIALTQAVRKFQKKLADSIFGKDGVYNRYILGPRMSNSFRAVIVPKQDMNYHEILVPEEIYKSLRMDCQGTALIGRDPTIWNGSIEFVKVRETKDHAIHIHPLLLTQLGGDFDGDQIWGLWLGDITKYELVEYTKIHGRFGKEFQTCNEGDLQAKAQAAENMEFTPYTATMSKESGKFSNKSILGVLDNCNKGIRSRGSASLQELSEISKGLSTEKFLDVALSVNRALLAMKVYMGPVGLVSLRLMALAQVYPQYAAICDSLSERCSQSLLDAKHLSSKEIMDYKPAKVSEILNFADVKYRDPEVAFRALFEITKCDNDVKKLLYFLCEDGRGLAKICKEQFPLFEGTTFTGESDVKGYMPEFILQGYPAPEEGLFSYAYNLAMGHSR